MEFELKLEGNKRSREVDLALSEDFLDQRSGAVLKRLCSGLEIKDASIVVSMLETDDAEEDGCYDQVELDEAQERLVFGVMRSLEEELRVPTVLSPSGHLYENETASTAVDSERFPSVEHAFSACDISQTTFPSPSAEDSPDEKFLDLADLLEKPSQITDQGSPQSICNVKLHTEQSVKEKSLHDPKRIDIGYLLEASDDELGISPSPRSESPSSEVGLVSYSFQATEYASSGSSYDSLHPQPWQSEWDWSSGGHFDLEFENDPASQELMKSAFSNLKASSIWAHSSIDSAAASLEPACASH